MTQPVYITEVSERVPKFPGGIEMSVSSYLYFDIDDRDIFKWYNENHKRNTFTFPNLKSEGVNLFYELCEKIRRKDVESINKILSEIEKYCIKNYEEKTEVEKWAHAALQLPGDWGPKWENKAKLKRIVTKKAYGRVLEPMCGFRSYFDYSNNITEVVALDFCKEALERYDYPRRKRVLYDLERVVNGEKMDFFEDSSFDTIGIFFGIDYLTNPRLVHREFHRILSSEGQLLIVGGTTQGYGDLIKRWFKPDACSAFMESAGFSTKIEYLPIRTKFDLGKYYLVEGKKN